MDFIKKFDIELEKENYYAGELLRGWVIVENVENLKVKGEITSIYCSEIYPCYFINHLS